MEITREKTGEQTELVKMVVSPADYSERVNKVIKDYQRKANVPGFRPGHVPFGMIKKLYGPSVFAEEVNKLVSDSLFKYVEDEKLKILGQPLPNEENTPEIEWNENTDLVFFFDIGLSPEFDLVLSDKISVEYNKIKADDTMIDRYIDDMRQRFGKSEEVETVEVNDVIYGTFTQVDNQGNTVPQGHESTSHISVNLVKDEAEQKLLLGATKDSRIVFNPLRGTGNETETAGLLNIKKDETELMQADYALTIQSITRMIPAELNEDFIKQIYPDSEVTTVEALRERVRAEAETAFIADSDHLFGHHMQEKLLAEVQFSLPEAFMKRWILENNQGKISVEEMERDYSKYVDSMRWQLIENRIIIDGKIEVGDAEIKDTIKDYYLRGWRTMQLTDDLNNRLEEIATSHLKSKPEETRRILDSLYSQKVVAYVKSKVKLVEKEISYDEFMKIDAEKH